MCCTLESAVCFPHLVLETLQSASSWPRADIGGREPKPPSAGRTTASSQTQIYLTTARRPTYGAPDRVSARLIEAAMRWPGCNSPTPLLNPRIRPSLGNFATWNGNHRRNEILVVEGAPAIDASSVITAPSQSRSRHTYLNAYNFPPAHSPTPPHLPTSPPCSPVGRGQAPYQTTRCRPRLASLLGRGFPWTKSQHLGPVDVVISQRQKWC